jgi:DNA-binding NtrC family response regulator
MQKKPAIRTGREKITLLAVCPQDDLSSLRNILDSDSFTLHHAQNCDEAMRAIERENPAVVACESVLPDGNWRDLYNLSIRLQDPPPVVVVSRNADETLWAEVLNLGGYDVLAKPFDRMEVSRVFAMASRYGRAHAVHP